MEKSISIREARSASDVREGWRKWLRPKGDIGLRVLPKPCASGLLSGGFEDQPRDFLRVRDQREMAGLHLDCLGAHPLGHEALEVRIDGAVFRRNGIESRVRSTCGLSSLAGEQCLVERLLDGVEHLRFCFWQVAGEITQERSLAETSFIAIENYAGRRRRRRIRPGPGGR